ncbi:MAG: ParB/RepB/Spo0J family partition protein [candidate division WOR-3 bacterium]
MSKQEKFKSLAQAALSPVPMDDSNTLPPELDLGGLHGTERLKAARLIPIDRLRPDPQQPRRHFRESALRELTASITAHGVLQPLTVSYHQASDTFTIVTGERRYWAAQRAGLTQLPCIIVNELTEQERLYHQLVENLQREDITPFEEADAFGLLVEKFHLNHQQIAQIVGKSRTYVTKTIGLARIPEAVRRLCAQRGITSREQFIMVAQQKTEPAMLAFLDQLAQHGNDVRTARMVARRRRAPQHRQRPFEYRYQTRAYTVWVRFAKRKASKREIADALTEAVRSLEDYQEDQGKT